MSSNGRCDARNSPRVRAIPLKDAYAKTAVAKAKMVVTKAKRPVNAMRGSVATFPQKPSDCFSLGAA